MVTLTFQIDIHAPPNIVYRFMLGLNDKNDYNNWASVFQQGTTYIGNWEKGSTMKFVNRDKNNLLYGSLSQIEEHIPEKFVSIYHLGLIQEGKELLLNKDGNEPFGFENYAYTENDGITTVTVTLQAHSDYSKYFQITFPKALEKLKNMVEKKQK